MAALMDELLAVFRLSYSRCGNHLLSSFEGTCVGIPYLLVITTPIDIYMLGVTFGDVNRPGK